MSAAAAARKLVFGVIAEFPSAAALYEAAEKVRDQGCPLSVSHPRNEQGHESWEIASGIHHLLGRFHWISHSCPTRV